MKNILFYLPNALRLILLGTTLLAVLSCNNKNYAEPDVAALLNEYREALSGKSPEKVAQVFHEDAVIMAPGKSPIRGRENITRHFKNISSMDLSENFKVQEILVAGDFVIVQTDNTGEYTLLDSGQKGSFNTKGQMVLKPNEEGKLKIYRYAFSDNSPAENTSPATLKGKFVHTVLFWLTTPESAELQRDFEAELTKFISGSPHIASVHIGTPATTNRPIIDTTYDYCLVVTFDNKEAHDRYQEEPAHEVFRQASKDMLSKVLIYDSVRP